MANNPILFNAALNGATSGMVADRVVTSPAESTYFPIRDSAVTFATAVDAAIAAGEYSQQAGNLMEGICLAVMSRRGSAGSSTQVVTAVVALFEALESQLEPEGGGDSSPLTNLRWVDPLTTVAADSQNGSEGAPFATVLQAFNALNAIHEDPFFSVGTIVLCDGQYLSETVQMDGTAPQALNRINLVGFGGAVDVGTWELTHATIGVYNLGRNDAPAIEVDGVSGITRVYAENTNFSIISGNADILAYDCRFTSAIACTNLTAYDSEFDDIITSLAEVALYDCQALGSSDIDAAAFVRMVGCIWSGSLTSVNAAYQLINTYMFVGDGPANVTTTNGLIELKFTRVAGVVTGAQLQSDSVSYVSGLNTGITFVISGGIEIVDAARSATVTIAVPAVAADAVGYVDTNLVGTPAEGFFTVANQPVIVNPQVDLIAAGAGGGFINARIVSPNLLRCAFNGALSSGNRDFTVSVVR